MNTDTHDFSAKIITVAGGSFCIILQMTRRTVQWSESMIDKCLARFIKGC